MTREIDWDKMDGLVPTIVQESWSGEVLMLAFMSRESLATTFETGNLTFWSRKKKRLWTKGEESGAFLEVVNLSVDCDGDTILAMVNSQGDPDKICHLGNPNCFTHGVIYIK